MLTYGKTHSNAQRKTYRKLEELKRASWQKEQQHEHICRHKQQQKGGQAQRQRAISDTQEPRINQNQTKRQEQRATQKYRSAAKSKTSNADRKAENKT